MEGGRGGEYCSHIRVVPLASAAALSAAEMAANRAKTDLTLPPFSMEMMRQWSSSFTQHSAVLASLWKMPRSCAREFAGSPQSKIQSNDQSAVVVASNSPRQL